MVNRIGALQVQFDTFNFHGSPDFPPNGTITNGNVYLQSGAGPQTGRRPRCSMPHSTGHTSPNQWSRSSTRVL